MGSAKPAQLQTSFMKIKLLFAALLIAPLCAISIHAGTPAQDKEFVDKYKAAFEKGDKATLESFLYTKGANPMDIVTHHPFDLPDGRAANERLGRAGLAMEMVWACRCDLLLAGHLHVSDAGSVAMHTLGGSHDAIVVQAGTATSTRGRGEINSFNAIHVEANRIEVQRFGWRPLDSVFESMGSERFERTTAGWQSRSPPSAA
jgi:hypothetical protein